MACQGHSQLIEQHLVDLASDVPVIYDMARSWFLQQGPEITGALVKGLEDDRLGSVGHWRILLLLAAFAQLETLPAILKALRRGDPIVQPGAMEALAAIRTTEAIDALITLLQEDNPDVVRHAAILLGNTGGVSAVEPLLHLLDSDNPSVRYSAAKALIQLDGPPVRVALQRHLENETDLEVRELIASVGVGVPNKGGKSL
jgi:HEAT repeat protein